jgi:polysaccharide biosynthesis protein PslH
MGKKILIISPTPTHPTNAGNRVRILNMASFIILRGHEVHFLYSRQENADEDAMNEFWGERYHPVDYQKPQLKKTEMLRRKFMQLLNTENQYYSQVDEYYNPLLDDKIKELAGVYGFDVILVEYIFLSRAFLNFDHRVVKVLDTHDVMTDRHKLFLKKGRKPVWYSVTRRQEKKGINRADVVIAIQDKEKAHFSRMTAKKVVNIGHLVRIRKPVSDIPRMKLLFVGSDNPSNLYGINDFISDYFPEIRKSFPGMELMIAGNICSRMEPVPDGVILLGEMEDIAEVYEKADIVINPLTIGTGLKIKMIEALGLSKVVISTPVGAEGLEGDAGEGYLLYRNLHEFIEMLRLVLSDQAKCKEITSRAEEITKKWNLKNAGALQEICSDKNSTTHYVDFSGVNLLDDQLQHERLIKAFQASPETQKFLIISIPRSGSNLLVGLLSSHNDIICYPELFHPKAIYDGEAHKMAGMPEYPIELRDEDPARFLRYIYSLRFGKDPKTIGFKIFPGHNDFLMEQMIKDPGIKKILLIRENFLMNFISHKSAQKSQVFWVQSGHRIPDNEETRFTIDFDEFLRYEKRFQTFFCRIRQMLSRNNQIYYELNYEDILKPEYQSELLKFLGVSPEIESLRVESEKQNRLPIEQKVTNYRELTEHLIKSGREAYLRNENYSF